MALENIKKDTQSSGMLLLMCHSYRKLEYLWCMLVSLTSRCNHNVTCLVESFVSWSQNHGHIIRKIETSHRISIMGK